MCALHASLVLFGEDTRSGTRADLVRDLVAFSVTSTAASILKSNNIKHLSAIPDEDGSFSTAAAEEEGAIGGKSYVTPRDLADSFEKATEWWSQYYERQDYERRFVEHQTGLDFSLVEELMKIHSVELVKELRES